MATCLGCPAIALTGLKLGMAAAMGGGLMGYATGRIIEEHEYDIVLVLLLGEEARKYFLMCRKITCKNIVQEGTGYR